MKILHYIPVVKADDLVSDYVKALMSAMEDIADVQLATRKNDVRKSIGELNPDIVHVHACWDRAASEAVRAAYDRGVALVVSPHNGLEPYVMRHEQCVARLLKRFMYQYRMICRADALVATSRWEYDSLMALGWKKRVCMVPSSLFDSRITASRMAENVLAFYKKILDTRYFRRMSDVEKKAFCSLLHVSKLHDMHHIQLSDEHILDIRSLNMEQWRRILLYADDEGVRPLVDKAICLLHVDVPGIDTSSIDRYHTSHPKDTGRLEGKVMLEDKTSVKNRLDDEVRAEESVLRTICIMLLNVRCHLRRKTLSMRHMAELYEIVRYGDYDEDHFVVTLKRLGIKKFAARILQVLKESMYLTDGFIPSEPLDDHGTQQIRNVVIH